VLRGGERGRVGGGEYDVGDGVVTRCGRALRAMAAHLISAGAARVLDGECASASFPRCPYLLTGRRRGR
jgi:hypothetical protein